MRLDVQRLVIMLLSHDTFLPFARSRSRAAASLSAGISFPSREVMRLGLSRLDQAAVGLSFSRLRGAGFLDGATFSLASGLLLVCSIGLAGRGFTGTDVPVRMFGRSKIVSGLKRLDSSGTWISVSSSYDSLTGSGCGLVETLAGCSGDSGGSPGDRIGESCRFSRSGDGGCRPIDMASARESS